MAKLQPGDLVAEMDRRYPRVGRLGELAGAQARGLGDLGRLAKAQQAISQGNLGRWAEVHRALWPVIRAGRVCSAATPKSYQIVRGVSALAPSVRSRR